MGMMQEFKEFAMKGNVVDLAVGVIIGGAFGKIVAAMVDKIFNPVLGMMLSGVDFSQIKTTLKAASVDAAGKAVPGVEIGWGDFINTIIQFVMIAFVLFLVIKAMNKAMKKQAEAPAPPPAPNPQETLLAEIRDVLKSRA
ncbi:MAG: large-conductance mechanosensitive channel protein MscL [Candidatus Kapabacteria bacterium]|nr:large-conductance mechanosensitive channel protein MscL [Candidatus Kapabacteria bacterium]